MTRSYSRSARSRGERFEMSGARPPSDGDAADADGAWGDGGSVAAGARVPPKRCPARSATSARRAMAATLHGSTEDAVVRDSALVVGVVPTAVPQRWQKRAPGERSERQP